jgi:hypothetical protein
MDENEKFVKILYPNARICRAVDYPYYMRGYKNEDLFIIDFDENGKPGQCLSFPRNLTSSAWETAAKVINRTIMDKFAQ